VKAEDGLYAAFVDEKIALKLGTKDWTPGEGFKLMMSGDGFAVWGKSTKKTSARRR
jgi:alpha-amylase